VILLDEPTNHLDIASCEALENSLRDFPGTILCVSHDRYFLEKIVKRLLVLRPPHVIDFSGTYQQWHEREVAPASGVGDQKARPSRSAKPQTPNTEAPNRQRDNPYLRPFGRHTKEQLEHEITETEIAIADCQSHFGDSDSFKEPARAKRLQEEYEALAKKLTALEAEYFARE